MFGEHVPSSRWVVDSFDVHKIRHRGRRDDHGASVEYPHSLTGSKQGRRVAVEDLVLGDLGGVHRQAG